MRDSEDEWTIRGLSSEELADLDEIMDVFIDSDRGDFAGDIGEATAGWPEWKKKVLAEMSDSDDIRIAVSPVYVGDGKVSGDFNTLQAIGVIVPEFLKKDGRLLIFECRCDNMDGAGCMVAMGPKGWNYCDTEEMEQNPLKIIDMVNEVAGPERALKMLDEKRREILADKKGPAPD